MCPGIGDGGVENSCQLVLGFNELDVVSAGKAACEEELMVVHDLPQRPTSGHHDRFQARSPTIHDCSGTRVAHDSHGAGHQLLELAAREIARPGRVLWGSAGANLDEAVDPRLRRECPSVDPSHEPIEGVVIGPYGREDEAFVAAATGARRADQ